MSVSGLLRNILICLIVFAFAPAWGSQNLVVADFSRGVDGKGVPSGWQLKERIGKADFSVIRDDGKHALRLRSDDASFAFQKPLKVNPRHYPVLSWKWKVTMDAVKGRPVKSNSRLMLLVQRNWSSTPKSGVEGSTLAELNVPPLGQAKS